MTITTCAPTVDANGISAPTYADILDYLQVQYRAIYGSDVYLESDSQDGQFIAIIASALNDVNSACVSVYSQFSPSTAVGAGLASVVKVNGITKEASSSSTVDVTLAGVAGTTISDGVVQDSNGVKWDLPSTTTIPSSGQITVTATCETTGAVEAVPGSVTVIATPTRGWQTVTNISAAAPGSPVESDAALRIRQKTSVAIPSLTVLEGMVGAVANVAGVTRYAPFENDTDETDANGIPSHTIALVVEGGDATAIATAIAKKKTPGGGTAGTTVISVTDSYGIAHPIRFYRPTDKPISVAVSGKALNGYSSSVGALIQEAIASYINGIAIGGGDATAVEWDQCVAAAKGVTGGGSLKITSLTLSSASGAGDPDVTLLFNEAATCSADDVTLTIATT